MPSANTLVRWVNENAFASIVQARPCPTFGRPVHRRGSPHRLRPGTSPHALRIPPRDGHPALRSANLALRPASRYSRFWIWHPSSECQRDFNPPEQCAAQRTLWPLLTSGDSSQRLSAPVAQGQTARPPRVLRTHLRAYACRIYVTAFRASTGLCVCLPAHPTVPPLSAACSSGQRFAYSFLQIPPRDRHPCCSANTSPCRVCRGLAPPSECALPGAQTGNARHRAGVLLLKAIGAWTELRD